MKKNNRLRFKLYIMILPLVVMVVLLSGILASLESRAALTRIANRHMAFKAEQLRDYFFSEWGIITNLGLGEQEEYRAAAEESFRSYAFSLLRSETELIVVFDPQGEVIMQVGLQLPAGNDPSGAEAERNAVPAAGWFTEKLFGQSRVGVAFKLEPFRWTVAVTELHSTFFSDVQNIQEEHILILVIALVVVTIFLSVFVGHVVQPVERLSGTIGHISETGDLTQRAQIEYADEIGVLAHKFNGMIATLQTSYRQLEAANQAEKHARRTAVEREEETLYILGQLADFRDQETGEHLRRIGDLSALFSALLGHSLERQNLIRHSSPLHDIGKIGIPDSILLKPGKLTSEEFEQMKRHTVYGYDLLKDTHSIYLIEGAKISRTHHEKWDGSGYPEGLSGEDIPLSGRIVSIVDVFDALTSERPYKEAWSFERALDFIIEQRGKQFDPVLVDLFQQNFRAFTTVIEHSNQETAQLSDVQAAANLS